MAEQGQGDAAAVGGPQDRLLAWAIVHDMTGLSRSTAWRLQQTGAFPHPVALSPGRVGWWESELTAWKRARPPGRFRSPARPRLPGTGPRARRTPGEAPAAVPALEPPEPPLRVSPVRVRKRRPAHPDQIDFGF